MASHTTHKRGAEGKAQTLARKNARALKRVGLHTGAIMTVRKGA